MKKAKLFSLFAPLATLSIVPMMAISCGEKAEFDSVSLKYNHDAKIKASSITKEMLQKDVELNKTGYELVVEELKADDEKGTLEVKYHLVFTKTKEVSTSKTIVFDKFLKNSETITNDTLDQMIKKSVAKYANVSEKISDANVKAKLQKDVEEFAKNFAGDLNKEVLNVKKEFENIISSSSLKIANDKIVELTEKINGILADVVKDVAEKYAANTKVTDGIASIKNYLTKEKLEEKAKELGDFVKGLKDTMTPVVSDVFDYLSKDESTKSIAKLADLKTEMVKFFNEQFEKVGKEISEHKVDLNNGYKAALDSYVDILKKVKSEAAAKARTVLTNENDYNAAKAVLGPKYEAAMNIMKNAIEKLVEHTRKLGEVLKTNLAN